MSIIYFPAELPAPKRENYGITPDNNIIRTEMESGLPRQRQRFTQTPSKVAVSWKFTQSQLGTFEAWYTYEATAGAGFFRMDLDGGLGMMEHEARFVSEYDVQKVPGGYWDVTTVLEIRDRPMLTRSEYFTLRDVPLEPLEAFSTRLHTVVHETL